MGTMGASVRLIPESHQIRFCIYQPDVFSLLENGKDPWMALKDETRCPYPGESGLSRHREAIVTQNSPSV
ncbi:hypothetical protein MC885_020041 [Smutsia gigantea]|nr:hypothetical protein MC885_020041 [Smutsia gigantea]